MSDRDTYLVETMIRLGGVDQLGEHDEKVWAALEEKGWAAIAEASVARIYQHYKEHEFGVVTAFKGYRTAEENFRQQGALENMISRVGLGFIRLIGHGQEAGKPVIEPSFFVLNRHVPGNQPIEDFRDRLVSWGRQFDQDCVLHSHPEIGTERLDLVRYEPDPFDPNRAEKAKRIPVDPPVVGERYGDFSTAMIDFWSQLEKGWRQDKAAEKAGEEPEHRGVFRFVPERQLEFLRFANEPTNWIQGMMLGVAGDVGFEKKVYGTHVKNYLEVLEYLKETS